MLPARSQHGAGLPGRLADEVQPGPVLGAGPAGLAAALVGLWLSSYWVTVLGMATAIYALVAATNPRERTARQALSPQER